MLPAKGSGGHQFFIFLNYRLRHLICYISCASIGVFTNALKLPFSVLLSHERKITITSYNYGFLYNLFVQTVYNLRPKMDTQIICYYEQTL